MPVAQLIVVEGPNRGKTYEVVGRAVLGTGASADVRLDDRRAAERQAEIRLGEGGRFEIQNLDPRKIIFVNGEVVKRAKLAHGDWITIADTTLVFSEESPREKRGIDMPSVPAEEIASSQVVGRRKLFDSAESVLETFASEDATSAAAARESAQGRLATLYRVSTALASELNLQRLLETILDICFEVFPADRGFILLLDEDDRKLKPMASRVRGGAPAADGGAACAPDISRTIIREVFQRKESILSTDATQDRRFADMNASIVQHSMRSVLCAPFVRDGRVLGVIQLDTTSRSKAFTHADLDLLGAIAMQCAVAIENARAYKKKQEYARNLIYLGRATQRLSSFLDRERICKETVKAACSLLGCTKGSLLLVRKGRELGLVYAIGMSRELLARLGRQRVGRSFAQHVVETGQPLLVPSLRDLPPELRARAGLPPESSGGAGGEAEGGGRYASESFLIVPIFSAQEEIEARGAVIGCICVTDKLSRAPLSGNDLEMLQILAAQAGIALANAELYEKATIDTLTRVFVRRHFSQRLEVMIRNARHTGRPLSLVMIDVDHFKSVNDTYGHQAGDALLKAMGKLLKKSVRHDQLVARYGGEEFAIALPDVGLEVARRIAERIRATVEAHEFRVGEGRTLRRTASLGVAELLPHETREQLIERADQALYAAKQTGRNRVVVAPPAPAAPPPAAGAAPFAEAPSSAGESGAPAPEQRKASGRARRIG